MAASARRPSLSRTTAGRAVIRQQEQVVPVTLGNDTPFPASGRLKGLEGFKVELGSFRDTWNRVGYARQG